jgi:hypothetical protein
MFFLQTDFTPPSENGISLGAKVGIVVASIIILVLGILWLKCHLQKSQVEQGICKAINIVII